MNTCIPQTPVFYGSILLYLHIIYVLYCTLSYMLSHLFPWVLPLGIQPVRVCGSDGGNPESSTKQNLNLPCGNDSHSLYIVFPAIYVTFT